MALNERTKSFIEKLLNGTRYKKTFSRPFLNRPTWNKHTVRLTGTRSYKVALLLKKMSKKGGNNIRKNLACRS